MPDLRQSDEFAIHGRYGFPRIFGVYLLESPIRQLVRDVLLETGRDMTNG